MSRASNRRHNASDFNRTWGMFYMLACTAGWAERETVDATEERQQRPDQAREHERDDPVRLPA